ncbi:hypothetical protein BMETH_811_0 [methanotrophic bacterial endosymbiont of Bathymodiolus sp.]|jgi:hypothetical protein|nr:hypothetical protein BMETH_811_0 [methanotrophic bacterial endosymbiont of Bathymodiolus sp.]
MNIQTDCLFYLKNNNSVSVTKSYAGFYEFVAELLTVFVNKFCVLVRPVSGINAKYDGF